MAALSCGLNMAVGKLRSNNIQFALKKLNMGSGVVFPYA